jgi:predicted Fe-S protein YdhL (DUF1289 family)
MDTDQILAPFTIPTPCPMDWDHMRGNDRVRFCERCREHVYNLTVMSPDETASLLSLVRDRNERKCVRLYQRPDGTLTASGCQPGLQAAARPWQFTIRAFMAVIAGWAALLGLAKWLTPEQKPPKSPPAANSQMIMGSVAY